MTMRRYLWTSALLYTIIACLLFGEHALPGFVGLRLPSFPPWFHALIGVACLLVALLKLIGGWLRTPPIQIAALSAGVAMSVFLAVETGFEAYFAEGSWAAPALWGYVAFLTVAILPYARVGQTELLRLHELTAAMLRSGRSAEHVQADIEQRLDGAPYDKRGG